VEGRNPLMLAPRAVNLHIIQNLGGGAATIPWLPVICRGQDPNIRTSPADTERGLGVVVQRAAFSIPLTNGAGCPVFSTGRDRALCPVVRLGIHRASHHK